MLRRNSDRVRPPKIPGQSFHDCEGSGGTASQSRCESHECVHTHDTHSLHCTQIRKTPDRANVEIAPISVCTNSRAPEIPPRAETLGDTNPWHNSASCVHHGSASQISDPRVAPAQVRTQDDLFNLFIFQFYNLYFYFYFFLSFICYNINKYIYQLLAGVGRALFHGSGEELGKMIRRASTLCPDNLVLPWKKGKIWENGQKAIFLEFRVFAPWAKGVPWDGQKRPFLGGKGGGAGGGVLGLRRHIYTLSRGKWGKWGEGRGGGSKKDLEKFRGGRGGGLAGGRVGPRGDPQIHQNPKRSGVSNFDVF